jgi:hypothetical protein
LIFGSFYQEKEQGPLRPRADKAGLLAQHDVKNAQTFIGIASTAIALHRSLC